MSRSRRKTRIIGMTGARSEKKDKRLANRAFRRTIKVALKHYDDEKTLPLLREISNVYSFSKDGKQYVCGYMYSCPGFMYKVVDPRRFDVIREWLRK